MRKQIIKDVRRYTKMNKKIFAFLMVGILAIGVGSAAIVSYWGTTQIDMDVSEAITSEDVTCYLNTTAGGDYELCLLDVTNNLDREISADWTVTVQKDDGTGNYVNLIDDTGVLVALTEDVSYCFKTECTDPLTEWKTWMQTNPDWLDWYVTQPYEGEYDVALINNHGGNSVIVTPLIDGTLTFTESISELDNVQVALYVDSAIALESGSYRIQFTVSPTA